MTDFVMDNSVAMRWLLESPKKKDQEYAEDVLKALSEFDAVVPTLWQIEASSVLLGAETGGNVTTGEVEAFILQLQSLPIHTDSMTSIQALGSTLALARAYKLSSYDASYLELAIREGLPLATLDKDLAKAAKKADVDLYLK